MFIEFDFEGYVPSESPVMSDEELQFQYFLELEAGVYDMRDED